MKIEKRFTEFPLLQSCENSRNYWVTASTLEEMWQRDKTGSFLDHWNGPPHPNFFVLANDGKRLFFKMPCIQLIVSDTGKHSVYVQGGNKRLRWLLNSQVESVPVAIYNDIGIEKAGTGIIWQRVRPKERVKVLNDFDRRVILDEKLVQQALLDNFDGKEVFRTFGTALNRSH